MPRKAKSSHRSLTEAELEAEADTLRRLVADKALIPGIYNYCDRWCERCPLTARCLAFKTQRVRDEQRGRPRPDLENKEFWDELGRSLALAMHLVRREAKKQGLDLDDPAVLASAEIEERRRERIAVREGSALHQAAMSYWKAAQRLLERLAPELRATEEALATQFRLGAGQPEALASDINEALEVVQWYLFFIDVKLARAVSSRVADRLEDAGDFPCDADGSAKIALVAIDRSIGAWARLRGHLGGAADAILDLLVRLERLRRAAEAEFPRARAFRRPGFD